MGEFPERALVKGAAVGAHIELGRRAAGEVFRAALTKTITGNPQPREIFEQDLLWAFKRLDRDKDGVSAAATSSMARSSSGRRCLTPRRRAFARLHGRHDGVRHPDQFFVVVPAHS